MNPLINKQCRDYSKDESPLNLSQIEDNRRHTPEWQFCATENELSQTFHFDDYHQTIDFVNKVSAKTIGFVSMLWTFNVISFLLAKI